MRHYCSLTDRSYLPRLLAMYESLKRHSSEAFTLHVLAMDAETEEALKSLRLESLTVMQWPGPNRRKDHTWQEYCWLMASQWCDWLLMVRRLEELTYLDADLFFFGDPEVVFSEVGDCGVGIVPHRFIPSKRYLERNGLFNVGWVTFSELVGVAVCHAWAAQCLKWCYARNEEGKFGDQKYLDEWPKLPGQQCCVIQNIGAGLAPWNLANYELTEGPKVDGVNVLFYHFHEYEHGKRLTNYDLRPEDKRLIYEPYIAAYEAAKETLATVAA